VPDPREVPCYAAPAPQPETAGGERERKKFRHPAELSAEEERRVLAELDSPQLADKSVAQAYTIMLDEGCYLCSQATMHRLLRRRGTSGDRRAHAVHPARKKPELLAVAPNQVWSWDITKLRGPAKGNWYQLYVIMDIYSRKVIHWEIWPTETGLVSIHGGAGNWRQLVAGSGGSQGFPVRTSRMASSAVTPWAAAVSR
jgi:hypothetical protein